MLRSRVLDFQGSWVDRLPLIESYYDNSYHSNIQMAQFEPLYVSRFRSTIGLYEVGEIVNIIRETLEIAQSWWISYTDVRQRILELKIHDSMFLKFSPWNEWWCLGKGKLSHCYISPYQILKMVGNISYKLDLLAILALGNPVFHISILKNCVDGDSVVVSI